MYKLVIGTPWQHSFCTVLKKKNFVLITHCYNIPALSKYYRGETLDHEIIQKVVEVPPADSSPFTEKLLWYETSSMIVFKFQATVTRLDNH